MHPLTLELSNDDQIPLFDTLSRSSHLFLNRGATGGIGSWRERPHTDGSASQQWQAAQHLPAAKFFSAGNRQQLPPFLPLSRLGAGNSRQALLATSFFSPRSLMPFRGLTAWSTYRSASSPPALFLHPPHRCSRRLRRRQMIGMVPASKVSACRLLRQGHGDWTHGRVRTTVAVGRSVGRSRQGKEDDSCTAGYGRSAYQGNNLYYTRTSYCTHCRTRLNLERMQ